MNIQIFGKNKNFDTKKAERYFKERNIKFQKIDLNEKGLSKREFESIAKAVGGFENIIDKNSKIYRDMPLKYLSVDDQIRRILENPKYLIAPIVRNGSLATVGYKPDIWKNWK